MMSFSKFWFTMIVLGCSVSLSCPESPPGWTILDPVYANPGTLYSGDVAGQGESPGGSFICKVVQTGESEPENAVLSSASGTTSTCTWDATVPEPGSGWTPNDVPIEVSFELWSGGMKHDDVTIRVK